MPKKYSIEFKMDAVHLLSVLQLKGEIYVGADKINTVRKLVERLGISTSTLYDWVLRTSNELIPKKKLIPGEKIEISSNFEENDIPEEKILEFEIIPEEISKVEIIDEIIMDWEINIEKLEISLAQMKSYKEKLKSGDD